ncbi:MAG: DUF4125 family protein [Lachnospiraceae bacterium]|nr:DUF4125 family protein [Lachnospiraceae bacterium]
MDINQVTEALDALFAQEKIDEIPQFLESHIAQAVEEDAKDVLLTLYNEIIGFYRETGQYELSIENCQKAIALMDEMGIQDTIPYATTLLNAANAHRAAGLLQESLEFYNKVRPIYVAQLDEDDMYFANFYNNLSLLYQEMGDFESAKEQLENALYIVIHKPDKQFEVAVTQANLANTCIELEQDDEAKARAEEAIHIFEEIGVDDAHYSAALSALGSLYYMDKDYLNALSVMEKSRECVAKYLGTDNIQYQRLSDNIKIIKNKMKEIALAVEQADAQETAAETEMKEVSETAELSADTVPGEPADEGTPDENAAGEKAFDEEELPEDNLPKEELPEDNLSEEELTENKLPQDESNIDKLEEDSLGEETAESSEVSVNGEPVPVRTAAGEEQIPEELDELEEIDTKAFALEIKGLELCRRYYEEYGRPMIAEKFHDYESVIAVGLVGKGSDCFGFDDALSQDHDYGPRFVMWVTKEVYEQIGEALQAAYEALPKSFMGIDRIETFHGRDRCGVMIIEDFYKNVLGLNLVGMLAHNQESPVSGKESMETIKSWLAVHDYALAAAVNGEVFRDDEGIFTGYRKMLEEYYPKAVWYRKIAQTCALFSQNGQYNLPRMRMRGQLVAAELAKAECAKHAMKLYYLLNRTYAPHDKWLFKGMPENPRMTISGEGMEQVGVAGLVRRISLLPVDQAHEAKLATAIESLAVIFANELEKMDIVGKCDLYLDACTKEITAKSDALLTAIVANTPVIKALSLSIAKAEFEAFDKVQNEGGRASCQNNWPTFRIMRMSQYMTWTEEMLLQYLYEFKANYANGRNMIEEKYARMMESTAPLEYASFAAQLPPVSDEKKAIMEQVIGLQVKWMEEFAAEYPNLAEDARRIHTSEDLPYDTSYETYLRGELGTYSDRMIEMYGRYIVEHAQQGRNVAREIMENTVHFYGYQNLEAANAANQNENLEDMKDE